MDNYKFLVGSLLLTVVMGGILPLYNEFVSTPAMIDVLKQDVEQAAVKASRHIVKSFEPLSESSFKTPPLYEQKNTILELKSDYEMTKIKIFSSLGLIVFSSEYEDLGKVNKKDYFQKIVAKGKTLKKLVSKKELTMEGVEVDRDVAEIYVPVMVENKFIGAFEFYFDVTSQKKAIDRISNSSLVVFLLVTLGFFALLSIIGFKMKEAIKRQSRAEQEKAELEEQLRQKHKMDAVGIMAGGVAHNFNNSLAIIMGNIELTQYKFDPSSQEYENLEHALTAARKSVELVRQIMTYSHQGLQGTIPVRIAEVIDEALKLVRPTLPPRIDLQCQIPPESSIITIEADPTQLQEALVNLCKNAVQAMPGHGILTLSLHPVMLRQKDIPKQYQCSAGSYARLSVQDTGCGMTSEILEKIFDPFFTTRDLSERAGIGLSTVQGIMKQHEGLIKVQSTPGEGTTFELYFPLVKQ